MSRSHDSSFSKSAPASPPHQDRPRSMLRTRHFQALWQQRGQARQPSGLDTPNCPLITIALPSRLDPGFQHADKHNMTLPHDSRQYWLRVKPQQQFPSPERPMFASRPSISRPARSPLLSHHPRPCKAVSRHNTPFPTHHSEPRALEGFHLWSTRERDFARLPKTAIAQKYEHGHPGRQDRTIDRWQAWSVKGSLASVDR